MGDPTPRSRTCRAGSTSGSAATATRTSGNAATCADGGRIRYLANAGLDHRRLALTRHPDAPAPHTRLVGRRGAIARRGLVYPMIPRLRSGAPHARGVWVWHIVQAPLRNGIVMGAEVAGRIRETWPADARPAHRRLSVRHERACVRDPCHQQSTCHGRAGRCARRARAMPWRLRRAARAGASAAGARVGDRGTRRAEPVGRRMERAAHVQA